MRGKVYRTLPLILWTFLLFFVSAAESVSSVHSSSLAMLRQRAAQMQLWQSPAWLRLLHYEHDSQFGKAESRIDSGSFFLSPAGQYDPIAEGEATLVELFGGNAINGGVDKRCQYPARYHFLKTKLAVDLSVFPGPDPKCEQLNLWLAGIKPAGVTLVFPVSYLNNPASMFGHTLLRIDSSEFSPAHPLLTASVGFAAVTEQEHGLGYAIKGIFGGYTGAFTAESYYIQANRYGQIESRDIWEYPLNLSAQETQFLLLHVWELRNAGFSYYFFDENCSFQLLALMEAVRPSLDLADSSYRFWNVPVDTVRDIVQSVGMLGKATYRPSLKTRLESRASAMGPSLVALAKEVAFGRVAVADLSVYGLSPVDTAQLLEFAHLYYQYAVAVGVMEEEKTDDGRLHLIGTMRSSNTVPVPSSIIEVPGIRPDQGHAVSRFNVDIGSYGQQPYLQMGIRPVFHDVFDPQGGFEKGVQIEALYPQFRYYPELERVQLESFDVLDILSVPPATAVAAPLAWKTRLGLQRLEEADSRRKLTGNVEVGFGFSRELGKETLLYGLAGGRVLVADRFDHLLDAGPAIFAGIVTNVDENQTVGLTGQVSYMVMDRQMTLYDFSAVQSFYWSSNVGLQVRAGIKNEGSQPEFYASLSWHKFFRF